MQIYPPEFERLIDAAFDDLQTELKTTNNYLAEQISNWFAAISGGLPPQAVYKNPECGCCVKWVEYLEDYGYEVNQHNVRDVYEIKRKLGVPLELSACHTAVIDNYIVEGHITHRDIKRLLLFRPDVKGIAGFSTLSEHSRCRIPSQAAEEDRNAQAA